MHKPTEATPAALGKLIEERLNSEMLSEPHSTRARLIGISPTTLNDLRHGKVKTTNISSKRRLGLTESIVRVCSRLDLDVPACLAACGLPVDARPIARAAMSGTMRQVEVEDLEKLITIKLYFPFVAASPIGSNY